MIMSTQSTNQTETKINSSRRLMDEKGAYVCGWLESQKEIKVPISLSPLSSSLREGSQKTMSKTELTIQYKYVI